MKLLKALKALLAYLWPIPAILIVSNLAFAGEDVCRDAGLTGKGLGLCTAYCEAMDCDSENPNANETACEEVQSKFLNTTGLVEMPCGAGTGEPPIPNFVCPCDFSIATWQPLLTDVAYTNFGCAIYSTTFLNAETILVSVWDDSSGNSLVLDSSISDVSQDIVKGRFWCTATKFVESGGPQSQLAPRPFGGVELTHTFAGERIPEQLGLHEACENDINALVENVFPGLVCDEQHVDPKIVFVTSEKRIGYAIGGVLPAPPVVEGGVEITMGGDNICADAAEAAGLSGTFLAWLSDSAVSPASRFTQSTEPYVLVDGTRIAHDWSYLVSVNHSDTFLLSPINLDEFGNIVDYNVWTGTRADGTRDPLGRDCNGWSFVNSDNSDVGIFGGQGTTPLWTDSGVAGCNVSGGNAAGPKGIVCFEQ